MTKKKTEENVTWSPYGNSFKNTQKAFILILYVEVDETSGSEISPTVCTSDKGVEPRTFRSRLEAEKFLREDLFKGGTTYDVKGYEIKQIQLVKMIKLESEEDESNLNDNK